MKKIIIHPFLFALFHILFLFSYNVKQVSYSDIMLPSAFVVGITLLLILVSRLISKDSIKVAVLISISIILFFSYGRIFDLDGIVVEGAEIQLLFRNIDSDMDGSTVHCILLLVLRARGWLIHWLMQLFEL